MRARRLNSPCAHFSVIGWLAQCRSSTAASSSSRKGEMFLSCLRERLGEGVAAARPPSMVPSPDLSHCGGRGRLYRRCAYPAVLADVDGHAVGPGELALEVLRADGHVRLAL